MSKFRSLEEMFGGADTLPVQTGEKNTGDIVHLPIDELHPYSKQSTFRPYTDQKMQELVSSIKEHGVLSPVLVRLNPYGGGYEIIAGYNRTTASKLAEKNTIPVIIRDDLDDEAADILFVETNFMQREELAISERAKGYRVKYDAIRNPGKGAFKMTKEISGIHSGQREMVDREP